MSHPKDRRDRFLISKNKGERRVPQGMKFRSLEDKERWCRIRRNTTAICSCSMCGNPRRAAWKDKLTMQEKKLKNWKSEYDGS